MLAFDGRLQLLLLRVELQLNYMSLGHFGPAVDENFSRFILEICDRDVELALALHSFLQGLEVLSLSHFLHAELNRRGVTIAASWAWWRSIRSSSCMR